MTDQRLKDRIELRQRLLAIEKQITSCTDHFVKGCLNLQRHFLIAELSGTQKGCRTQ